MIVPRGTRLTGYRSRIVFTRRGRVVETHRNTVITTTIREALTSGLRSLAGYFDRNDADTAVISIEWQGPAERVPRNPPYEVTIALPSREESAR